MKSSADMELPRVGWREWVALPELGIARVKAKVDTGARTSSLHAHDLEIYQRGRRRWVRFEVHPFQRDSHRVVAADAPLVDERRVKSSTGHAELRPVIRTPVRVLGVAFDVEITLTRRDDMGFRMLLGREALRGRFVVDPGRSYYGGRPPRAKKTKRSGA